MTSQIMPVTDQLKIVVDILATRGKAKTAALVEQMGEQGLIEFGIVALGEAILAARAAAAETNQPIIHLAAMIAEHEGNAAVGDDANVEMVNKARDWRRAAGDFKACLAAAAPS